MGRQQAGGAGCCHVHCRAGLAIRGNWTGRVGWRGRRHGEHDVAAAAGQAAEDAVAPFPFGAFAWQKALRASRAGSRKLRGARRLRRWFAALAAGPTGREGAGAGVAESEPSVGGEPAAGKEGPPPVPARTRAPLRSRFPGMLASSSPEGQVRHGRLLATNVA